MECKTTQHWRLLRVWLPLAGLGGCTPDLRLVSQSCMPAGAGSPGEAASRQGDLIRQAGRGPGGDCLQGRVHQ